MEGKWLFFPLMFLSDAAAASQSETSRQQHQGARVGERRACWEGNEGALWDGCSGRVESCWSPVPTPSPAEERRLGIWTDG